MNTTSSITKTSSLKSSPSRPSPLKPSPRGVLLPVAALGLAMLAFNAFGGLWRQNAGRAGDVPLPAARALPSDEADSAYAVRFLTARVRRDPEDFASQNRLAGSLLQRLHETSNHKYLPLAFSAARASLKAVPAIVNFGGLGTLARAEAANHEFGASRDLAMRLVKLQPQKAGPHALLGDALMELGDYSGAEREFEQLRVMSANSVETQTRLARMAVLRGQPEQARQHFSSAVSFAFNWTTPPRETIAWCYWQLGEVAFSVGDVDTAESRYRDALTTYPGYFRAVASQGRARAAQGDLDGAIARYQEAVRAVPDTAFLAALGDLYHLSGQEREARANWELAELSATTPANGGTTADHRRLHSRQLSIFLADHDLKPQQAYAMAKREYAARRDIYGADTLAWTALKANHVKEAQAAIKDALRLGTQDSRLFYHAGLIARAAGDNTAAHEYLQRALDLNPHFDPLQSTIAKKALND